MDRPYRDDEEQQAAEVVQHAKNIISGVHNRHLLFASIAVLRARESLDALWLMVDNADKEDV